jgi:signal peptidase II
VTAVASSAGESDTGSFARKLLIFAPLAMVIVALDLFTKAWVESRLGYGAMESVFGTTFQLANHRNTGGMWGVGSDWPRWILPTVRLGALGVIFYLLHHTPARDRLGVIALGLVMGGAIGNIHDSLSLGYVRDFLYFDFDVPVFDPFPTFNVADSAICVGVGLLALQMFRTPAPPAAA